MPKEEQTQPARKPEVASAGPIGTVEQWAAAKGMLPMFVAGPRPSDGSPPRQLLNPKYTHFAETKAGNAWPEGKEMTEADFDAAIAKNATQAYG